MYESYKLDDSNAMKRIVDENGSREKTQIGSWVSQVVWNEYKDEEGEEAKAEEEFVEEMQADDEREVEDNLQGFSYVSNRNVLYKLLRHCQYYYSNYHEGASVSEPDKALNLSGGASQFFYTLMVFLIKFPKPKKKNLSIF